MTFYKVPDGYPCVVCRAPATYTIVSKGEIYTRACDKHADQEVERLTEASEKRRAKS